MYISEISPPKIRGRLVALYQFAITIGILIAYFANAWLLKNAQEGAVNTGGTIELIFITEVWRAMLGSETIPAFLFFILVLAIPESPRWLVLRGKEKSARNTLTLINGNETAEKQLVSIRETIDQESASIGKMIRQGFLFPLVIGSLLALSSQLSGINAIIYYGPTILNEAGFKIGEALGGQVIIGVVNVLFTILAIWKIDQMGRRPLLITGLSGMLFFLVAVGVMFFAGVDNGILMLIPILGFIAFFAFSYGPVVWVLLSEIYPTRFRGRAMSVATLILWGGNVFVGQFVPWSLENLKPSGTFWAFALMTIPALYIAVRLLPETKGKSLEEIEKYWLNRKRDKT
jgi:sugar porter (SP) family MFS transporter